MPASAICATHGLRFDPQLSTGCVLCKRESEQGAQAARTTSTTQTASGPELVLKDAPASFREAVIGLIVANNGWLALLLMCGGIAFGVQRWMRGPDVRELDVVIGGSLGARIGMADRMDCRKRCAVTAENCSLRCDMADTACQRKCLRPALTCDETCVSMSNAGSPFFRYTRGVAPDWWVSLDRFDRVRPEILARCELEPSDQLDVHFQQLEGGHVQAVVDHVDAEKALCAAGLLGPALKEPSSKGHALFATMSLGEIDYQLLLRDALEEVEAAPGPRARAWAEVKAQAYTARYGRQQQAAVAAGRSVAGGSSGAAVGKQSFNESQRAEDPQRQQFEEERRALLLEEQRQLVELRRLQVQRGARAVTFDDISNDRMRGHVAHDGEKRKREYRRDDRATDRDTWDDVERMREKREEDEQRERWARDQKIRQMEWRNEMRRRQ